MNNIINADSYKNQKLCRVRAVTAFITLPKDSNLWYDILAEGKRQCDTLAIALQQAGYHVQSLRLVTNPFGEYLNTSDINTAKKSLAQITQHLDELNKNNELRIRFAIGEACTAHEIALLPELIKDYGDLCNACVNVPMNEHGFLQNKLIEQSVQAIQQIADITPNGEGNFNFTVNFNCDSYIPYFPASYHRPKQANDKANVDKAVVVGLETPDLLVDVLQSVSPLTPPYQGEVCENQTSNNVDNRADNHAEFMQQAYTAMHTALQYHVDKVVGVIDNTSFEKGWQFIGMDTSAAPSKDCASMVELYQLLGVPYFGASGTVEASSLLTKVFKSVNNVQQVGFSGLMLAVTEDTGLAKATINQQFDIKDLLTYSSVCGIGLDTVPIEGDTPSEKICAIMRDTGTMAFRLNKPLTVRLFPVPKLTAGEMTSFDSDDLCNCAVLVVP